MVVLVSILLTGNNTMKVLVSESTKHVLFLKPLVRTEVGYCTIYMNKEECSTTNNSIELLGTHTVHATALGSNKTSSTSLAAIPRSKTWSVMSTIQKLPTNHDTNNPVIKSHPTTVISTIQSNGGAITPRHSVVNTRRTSVSKIAKPSGVCFQPEKNDVGAEVVGISWDKTTVSVGNGHVSTQRADQMAEDTLLLSTINVLDEQAPDSLSDGLPSKVHSPGFIRLKHPVWDGPRAQPDSGIPPRRSKRFQGRSAKTKTASTAKNVTRASQPEDEDVSPTSSGTPLMASSETNPHDRRPISTTISPNSCISNPVEKLASASFKPIDTWQVASPTSHEGEGAGSKTISTRTISAINSVLPESMRAKDSITPGNVSPPADRPSQVTTTATICQPEALTRPVAQGTRASHSYLNTIQGTGLQQADDREDLEGPVLCSSLPSPFRRDSTVVSFPIRERISTAEGLDRPNSNSARYPNAQDGGNKGRPKSYLFLSSNKRRNRKKKTSVGLAPKTLGQMSVQDARKNKQPYNAMEDEGPQGMDGRISEDEARHPSSETDKAGLANNIHELPRVSEIGSFVKTQNKLQTRS